MESAPLSFHHRGVMVFMFAQWRDNGEYLGLRQETGTRGVTYWIFTMLKRAPAGHRGYTQGRIRDHALFFLPLSYATH